MKKNKNQKIAEIFYNTIRLLEIKKNTNNSFFYRKTNYLKAAKALENLEQEISLIYKNFGIIGIRKELNIGEKMAKKIEEYLIKGKIKDYEKLKEETAIQQIVTYYFETKGLNLNELKESARKRKIVYSRFTKPAKQLLELSGSIEKAKEAIYTVAKWAESRNLDYAIETVFKKWLELDNLKPKEIVKKPYYSGNPMVWSKTKKKWFVINKFGEWLEFAAKESEIEWRIEK